MDPEIHHIEGKAKSKIDTGLDSHLHNFYTAEIRRKDREKELKRRKQHPLTYPSKNETMRDQRRAVPS